jgi:hypothetical protein
VTGQLQQLLTLRDRYSQLGQGPRARDKLNAMAQTITGIVNGTSEFFSRLESRATPDKRAVADAEYRHQLAKVLELLGGDYYLDILTHPQLWDDPFGRSQAVEDAVRAFSEQIIDNIRQVNATQDIRFRVSLDSLVRAEAEAQATGDDILPELSKGSPGPDNGPPPAQPEPRSNRGRGERTHRSPGLSAPARAVPSAERPAQQDELYASAARAAAGLGRFDESFRAISEIVNARSRDKAFAYLAETATGGGRCDQSFRAISEIVNARLRDEMYTRLARTATDLGQFEWAYKATERIGRD